MPTKSASKTITRDPNWLGPAIPPGEMTSSECGKGTLDRGAFNFIFRACVLCNREKGNAERHTRAGHTPDFRLGHQGDPSQSLEMCGRVRYPGRMAQSSFDALLHFITIRIGPCPPTSPTGRRSFFQPDSSGLQAP